MGNKRYFSLKNGDVLDVGLKRKNRSPLMVYLIFVLLRMVCSGNLTSEKRIFGGYYSSNNEFANSAALFHRMKSGNSSENKYELLCGASMIDRYWAITHGTCIYAPTKKQFDRLQINCFTYDILTHNGSGFRMISQAFMPSRKYLQYDENFSDLHSIALLRLELPIDENINFKLAGIIDEDEEIEGNYNYGMATGFGTHYSFYGEFEKYRQLKVINLKIENTTECWKIFNEHALLFHPVYKFCSTWIIHEGVCTGDIGGGAYFIREDGDMIIGGIIEAFKPNPGMRQCTKDQSATLFLRLSPYVSWINEIRDNFKEGSDFMSENAIKIKFKTNN